MKRKWLLATWVLMALAVQAKVRLPHVLGNNMILQQESDARLWGWTEAGRTVTVTASWTTEKWSAKADKKGNFLLTVSTPKASYTPHTITFDDGEQLTVGGVLAGEVWVCAGQSNMEMPMKGFGQCPVEGYMDEVIDANRWRNIHYVKIPSVMRMQPQDDSEPTEWKAVGPETIGDASATGFFFAQTVLRMMDVPIGLVMANKGGSRVESWLTKENLQRYTDEPTDSAGIVAFKPQWDYHRAMLWGNGTFHPVLNYTVRGILFYQGCSNVGDPGNRYSERLALLVRQWREQFRLGEIPFYFVEIAPYHYDNVMGDDAARLREQQFRAAQIIPNSGLACTNDLVYPYEKQQIHPCQKRQVGQRLALLALSDTYGQKGLWAHSASYKDMQVKGDTVHIHLNNDYGAISRFEGIEGFEVAGEDRVFHPATAIHFWQPGGGYWDETIAIHSKDVKKPVAVRYCFRNFQVGNLKNAAGLPLFPFRTDNW